MDCKSSARNYDMATKLFKIKELLQFQKKSRRKAGEGLEVGQYPFFTSSQIQKKWCDEADYHDESIILGTGGGPSVHCSKDFSTSTDVFILTPSIKNVSAKYIAYFLTENRKVLERGFKGAGLKHISRDYVENIEIVVPVDHAGNPDTKEQSRIVRLLEEAEALKQKRELANEKTSIVIPALFNSMFGNPDTNEKNWKLEKLHDVCETIYRYPTFYGIEYKKTGIPVVRIGNILQNGIVDPDLSNYILVDEAVNKKFPKTVIELFDILMAVRGDGSTGKRIGLVTSENLIGANMSPNLLRFKTDKKILNPHYLFHLMISGGGQEIIGRKITRTAKKTITSTDIVGIEIPVPPISLQNEFAEKVKEILSLKENQNRSLEYISEVFTSLLSKSLTP